MKKFIAVVLTGLTINSHAQTSSVAMDYSAKEAIVASAYAEDGSYYVITGAKSTSTINGKEVGAKSTIFHYDANMNLLLKKAFKAPKYERNKFEILSLAAVGNNLLLFGKSDDFSTSKCNLGYTIIDPATLSAGSKITDVFEHGFAAFFISARTYEFRQNAPGKPVGIHIFYQDAGPADQQGRFTFDYYTTYLLIDEKLEVNKVLSFQNNDQPDNSQGITYYMANSGDMYVLIKESSHVELRDEWWEDERQLKKLSKVKSRNLIYRFDPASKQKSSVDFRMQDTTLLFASPVFFETAEGVFIGGTVDNSDYLYRRGLVHDTIATKVGERIFCFAQKLLFEGGTFLLPVSAMTQLPEELRKDLFTDLTISKEDRQLGAKETYTLVSALQTADGKIVFCGASYSDWNWPPYQEIKNDDNYTIEKDKEGNISNVSGPSLETTRKYHRFFTLTLQPSSGLLTGSQIKVNTEQGLGHHIVNDEYHSPFSYRSNGDHFDLYFTEKGSELYVWNGTEQKTSVPFTHDGDVTLANSAMMTSAAQYLVMNGAEGGYLIKLAK